MLNKKKQIFPEYYLTIVLFFEKSQQPKIQLKSN